MSSEFNPKSIVLALKEIRTVAEELGIVKPGEEITSQEVIDKSIDIATLFFFQQFTRSGQQEVRDKNTSFFLSAHKIRNARSKRLIDKDSEEKISNSIIDKLIGDELQKGKEEEEEEEKPEISLKPIRRGVQV